MNRKKIKTVLSILNSVVITGSASAGGKPPGDFVKSDFKRPNILFIFPDQFRRDWVGFVSDLPLRTPNIDQLAAQGVYFTRAYSPSPLCAPARACLASGLDYTHCGVRNNEDNFPLNIPTYYQALRTAGYRVASVGKLDLHKDTRDPAAMDWGLDGSRLMHEWGFTEGIDCEGKGDATGSYRAAGRAKGPYMQFLVDRGLAGQHLREHNANRALGDAYTTSLPEDAYCDNWIAEDGLRFLRGFSAGTPWHLVVNFAGPHHPMDVTPAMRLRWQDVDFPLPYQADPEMDSALILLRQQNYAAMIENIDRHIGRFLEAVRARGEEENTLIVFCSDHGEMLGEHGRWGKTIWQEGSTGVPLIIAGPGVRKGVTSSALVALQDLTATFIDVSRAEPLPGMDGKTLMPLLSGRVAAHRPYVISALNKWRMVADDRYKLVVEEGLSPQLFDLVQDPHEDTDRFKERADIAARLLAFLQEDYK